MREATNDFRLSAILCALPAAMVLIALAALPARAQEEWQYGACGGAMRGYDGRAYTCSSDRKPACDRKSGRCVCLLRTECGARQNEPY